MTLRNFELEYNSNANNYELSLFILPESGFVSKRFDITLTPSAVEGELLSDLRLLCHDQTSFGVTQIFSDKDGTVKELILSDGIIKKPILSLKKFF